MDTPNSPLTLMEQIAARQALKIGLAFSGGGFRAAIFQLGILARLAEDNLLEQVTAISTVSGGSLGMGLVFAQGPGKNFGWPTSTMYLNQTLSWAWQMLTSEDVECALVDRFREAFPSFTLLFTRAPALARILKRNWGLTQKLNELPKTPKWFINATCYESGKDWRFERTEAGDYLSGYTDETDKIELSTALAASAAFPALVGALEFDRRGLKLDAERPAKPELGIDKFPKVHLWDGGVYDNLGLEVFHEFDFDLRRIGWQEGVDFLVVGDASNSVRPARYQIFLAALMRMITGIMMDQVRSLRQRGAVARMKAQALKSLGVLLQISDPVQVILGTPKFFPAAEFEVIKKDFLTAGEVKKAESFQTTLRRLWPHEFVNLFRQGFEVMDARLVAHHREAFGFVHQPFLSSTAHKTLQAAHEAAKQAPKKGFRPCSWLAKLVQSLRQRVGI